MAQVISRSQGSHEVNKNKPHPWKKQMLVVFHAAAASTYGYAICWQNVSAASANLYQRTSPVMRIYGKWRFLTYNCLVMQFVAYSLCLTSQFVPRLRRSRDFFFTAFAFPIGMLVVSSFWTVWFVEGRESILPVALEPFYPPWLNHVTHTIIGPINLIELMAVKHQYSSDRKAIVPLFAYMASYTAYIMYIRFQTGRFVYPFLNKMDALPVGAFITGSAVFAIIAYKSGKLLHDLVHGVKSVRNKFRGEEIKKVN